MGWRFFQRFQQRVEGAFREHVDFVDDVDLGAQLHWRIAHGVNDLAHVVDASVRRGVHLDHVHVARFQNGFALGGHLGHVDGGAIRIVESTGDEAGCGCFANTTHACEHIGLGDAARRKSVGQGAHEGILANQVSKSFRAIFAGENAVTRCVLVLDLGGHRAVLAQAIRRLRREFFKLFGSGRLAATR